VKILIVTPWYPSERNPYAGAFVERDVRMLSAEHTVVVAHLVAPASLDGPEQIVRDGITVHRYPMAPSKPADWRAAARRLRALMRESDIVHSQAATVLWPVALAFGPLPPRLPWVHTEHSSALVSAGSAQGPRRLSTGLIRRYLYSRPQVVVTVSGFLADAVRALRHRPVVVVPNAVDAPLTPPPRPTPGDALRLVSVGGLTAVKRPGVAVQMLASLRDRGVAARLTWVGDGSLRAELDALVAELGVGDRLVWAGARAPADVSRFLADADMFVLPTEVETFGVAIAEAIAHGRPVVVGSRGGHVDFVSPMAGELVDGSNPDDYADAVIRLHERTRGLSAETIAATLGDSFHGVARLRRYDEVYAQAAAAARPGRPR